MTENQTKEVFKLLTRCVSGIQRLETDVDVIKKDVSELKGDVTELKGDVTELKTGQARLEERQADLEERQEALEAGQQTIISELRINNRIISDVVHEQARLGARVTLLEERGA